MMKIVLLSLLYISMIDAYPSCNGDICNGHGVTMNGKTACCLIGSYDNIHNLDVQCGQDQGNCGKTSPTPVPPHNKEEDCNSWCSTYLCKSICPYVFVSSSGDPCPKGSTPLMKDECQAVAGTVIAQNWHRLDTSTNSEDPAGCFMYKKSFLYHTKTCWREPNGDEANGDDSTAWRFLRRPQARLQEWIHAHRATH